MLIGEECGLKLALVLWRKHSKSYGIVNTYYTDEKAKFADNCYIVEYTKFGDKVLDERHVPKLK